MKEGTTEKCIAICNGTEVNLQQQKIVSINKNAFFEHCQKVQTINNLQSYIILSYIFTFSELPSISLFLYYIMMGCYVTVYQDIARLLSEINKSRLDTLYDSRIRLLYRTFVIVILGFT